LVLLFSVFLQTVFLRILITESASLNNHPGKLSLWLSGQKNRPYGYDQKNRPRGYYKDVEKSSESLYTDIITLI